MTSYSALSPVSAGVLSALSVATVTSLATGGIGDDITQGTGYPFVLFVVSETPKGGLGTQPGRGQLPQVDIRVHAFTEYAGGKMAQAICDAAIGAMFIAFDRDSPTVSIAGYDMCALFHDSTSEPLDSIVAGQKVKEVVAQFHMDVELQS